MSDSEESERAERRQAEVIGLTQIKAQAIQNQSDKFQKNEVIKQYNDYIDVATHSY